MAIKVKAKQFAQANAEAGKMKGLKFRRVKFFDMIFGIMLALTLTMGVMDKSYAGNGGTGTDPVSFMPSQDTMLLIGGGSGTDPRMSAQCLTPSDVRYVEALENGQGGGGHDPTTKPGIINVDDGGAGGGGYDPTKHVSYEEEECKLGTLVDYAKACGGTSNQFCNEVRNQAVKIWRKLKKQSDGLEI